MRCCHQGLADEYEASYMSKVVGVAPPDKAEPLRREAAALLATLCAKLDALSAFAFTPKPVIEELEVCVYVSLPRILLLGLASL